MQLKRFSHEVMAAAERTAFDIMEEQAARDATYREIYEAWGKMRAGAFEWFGTAELAYASYIAATRG